MVDGKHIRLLDTGGIDALMALDMRQGRQPVAIDGGTLEIQILGGFPHRCGNGRLDLLAAAREKILRLAHQFRIVGIADLAGAGAGAALDLVKQAGAAAGFKDAVGAGAQQKGALQRIDRPPDGARRGEGAEIITPCARARRDA